MHLVSEVDIIERTRDRDEGRTVIANMAPI